jgi:hypothetical protein
MFKQVFMFALLLLAASAFAEQTKADFFGTGYDYRQAKIDKPNWGSEDTLFGNAFGRIQYWRLTNTGGEDISCTLRDDNNTQIFQTNVTVGTTFLNRTVANYTNFGNINLSCISNFANGATLNANSTLAANWRFEEGRGNVTNASIGTARLYTAAELGQDPTGTSWQTGAIGSYAIELVNTYSNESMRINDTNLINVTRTNSTWAFWFNPRVGLPENATAALLHKGANWGILNATGNGTNTTALVALNNTTVQWQIFTNVTYRTVNYTRTQGIFNVTGWAHFALTFNGTDAKMYYNGALVANDTPTTVQNMNFSNQHWFLGDGYFTHNTSYKYSLWAYYDELSFFNTSITAAQASYLYNQSNKLKAEAKVVLLR